MSPALPINARQPNAKAGRRTPSDPPRVVVAPTETTTERTAGRDLRDEGGGAIPVPLQGRSVSEDNGLVVAAHRQGSRASALPILGSKGNRPLCLDDLKSGASACVPRYKAI